MGDGEPGVGWPAGYDPWTDSKLHPPIVLKVQNATSSSARRMVELAARIASTSFIEDLRTSRGEDVATFTHALDALASADPDELSSLRSQIMTWPELDVEAESFGARDDSAITLLHALTYAISGDHREAAYCMQRCLNWADFLDEGSGANYRYLSEALDAAITATTHSDMDQQASILRSGLTGLA